MSFLAAHLRWLPPIVLLVLLVMGVRACVAALTADEEVFAPVRLLQLEVEPNVITVGQPARLLNGFCSTSPQPLRAGFYLGLQKPDADPLFPGMTIDLVGKDTPEGRAKGNVEPGCTRQDPLEVRAVPATIPPGTWRAVVHIVVTGPSGETQSVTGRSQPFTVLAP